ncbi:unnamed protein product [Lampetra planeri]
MVEPEQHNAALHEARRTLAEEGEDCKSMEGNEMEMWRDEKYVKDMREEEEEEEDMGSRKSIRSEGEDREGGYDDGERYEEEVNLNLVVSNTDEDNASEPPDTNAPPLLLLLLFRHSGAAPRPLLQRRRPLVAQHRRRGIR